VRRFVRFSPDRFEPRLLDEEDAKRPARAREPGSRADPHYQPHEGWLTRLGIRGFKAEPRTSPARLETLRTPEDVPLPPRIRWPEIAAI
jgi:transposase